MRAIMNVESKPLKSTIQWKKSLKFWKETGDLLNKARKCAKENIQRTLEMAHPVIDDNRQDEGMDVDQDSEVDSEEDDEDDEMDE